MRTLTLKCQVWYDMAVLKHIMRSLEAELGKCWASCKRDLVGMCQDHCWIMIPRYSKKNSSKQNQVTLLLAIAALYYRRSMPLHRTPDSKQCCRLLWHKATHPQWQKQRPSPAHMWYVLHWISADGEPLHNPTSLVQTYAKTCHFSKELKGHLPCWSTSTHNLGLETMTPLPSILQAPPSSATISAALKKSVDGRTPGFQPKGLSAFLNAMQLITVGKLVYLEIETTRQT